MFRFFAILIIVLNLTFLSTSSDPFKELPYCSEQHGNGFVLVSTLDGKLSAINASGSFAWQIETGPGPLLISNIHKLELTNNGEWIRIIPSLSGTLYKFDGLTIDPIPISVESLLKSSFRYSDDLVIAGGIEIRTYGVGFRSGKLFYECTPLKCSHDQPKDDDVLLIERSTQTIRAIESRTGQERWNFSVGLHDIKLPQVSCIDTNIKFDYNISAVLPDGILHATSIRNNIEDSWQYKFDAPIVHVWHWNGRELNPVNLFAPKNVPTQIFSSSEFTPAIYIGMHKKQLYIHESVVMQNILQGRSNTGLAVAESKSIEKIPWNPISASSNDSEDDSTALSVLNGSEYVNGNGYYLYTAIDSKKKDQLLCEKNQSIEHTIEQDELDVAEDEILGDVVAWWKEALVIVISTILINVAFRFCNPRNTEQEVIFVDRPVVDRSHLEKKESESDTFTSRYVDEFETIQCLGKGGFGIVFEVKQKIDECHYAIKRITLPKGDDSRDRVMREVKALAKLDHQNIVRYFSSWVERPPLDWNKEHDEKYTADLKSYMPSAVTETASHTSTRRSKSASISIAMNNYDESEDDSFIVFENADTEKDESVSSNATISSVVDLSTKSDHFQKKVNWRRPSRKHHSWDLSQTSCVELKIRKPPMFLYIQMQLCQKQSLKDWLNDNPKREYDKLKDIFLQILDAVEYVHLRGLIHRDLKPSNIFFSLDGKIKVGDFGLVKDMEDTFPFDNTVTSAVPDAQTAEVGTQLYMSPEQFESGSYDYKVDIYSLGLVFFELLVPFSTGMERIQTISNLRKGIYPADFKQHFSNEYELLRHMLCQDPDKRLTVIGVKARPPFNVRYDKFNEEYHYRLPNFQKNL